LCYSLGFSESNFGIQVKILPFQCLLSSEGINQEGMTPIVGRKM
jgi:hypothetical protein